MTLGHPHGVALVQAVGGLLDLFPTGGVAEVFFRQINFQILQRRICCGVGAFGQRRLIELQLFQGQSTLEFIEGACISAEGNTHAVAFDHGLQAVLIAVVPAQAFGAAVQIGRAHFVQGG